MAVVIPGFVQMIDEAFNDGVKCYTVQHDRVGSNILRVSQLMAEDYMVKHPAKREHIDFLAGALFQRWLAWFQLLHAHNGGVGMIQMGTEDDR